jgi:hypothetical protein
MSPKFLNNPTFRYFEHTKELSVFRADFSGERKMAANMEEAEYANELHKNSENLPETV